MKEFTTLEIIKNLIGNVNPAGDSAIDTERLERLKELCELTGELLFMLDDIRCKNNFAHQHSIKVMVDYVENFLLHTVKPITAA